MNIKMLRTPKLVILVSMVSLIACTVGCKKEDKDTPNPPTGSSAVALLNAAFGSDSLHVFFDAKKVSSKLLGFGDSLKYTDVSVRSEERRVGKGRTTRGVRHHAQ